MGCVKGIDMDHFPKQGSYLRKNVVVCFNYNTKSIIGGVVVRDDAEEPGLMIIKLDDSRHVLSTECQWFPAKD